MEVLSWITLIAQLATIGFLFYLDHCRPEPERHPTCRSCRFCQPIPAEYQQFFTPAERMCFNGRGWDIRCIDANLDAISVVLADDYCSKYIPEGDHYAHSK